MTKVKDKVSHRAKLTPSQVRWARRQLKKKVSCKSIGAELGVSETTIVFLKQGKVYRGVA